MQLAAAAVRPADGQAGPPAFHVLDVSPPLPTVLPPGDSVVVTVACTPGDAAAAPAAWLELLWQATPPADGSAAATDAPRVQLFRLTSAAEPAPAVSPPPTSVRTRGARCSPLPPPAS